MNSQQFDNSEPARAQRMTAQETQAVIALWQQERIEQGGLTDRPALPDVAEGLDISVEDARRLLDQVRAQRTEEEGRLAQEQTEAELEQIRLAEEERKLAEVRRQRAELQRQRAEEERWRAEERRGWGSEDYGSLSRVHYGGQDRNNAGKVFVVVLLSLVVTVVMTRFSVQSVQNVGSPIYTSPCYDASGEVPCDAQTIAEKRQFPQQAQDQHIPSKAKRSVKVKAKKGHDRQPHRRDH